MGEIHPSIFLEVTLTKFDVFYFFGMLISSALMKS